MVHQIDTVHWFTGYNHPTSVVANGGIYLWRDGRKNFDTMTAVFDYGNAAKGGKGFQVIYSSRQTNSAGDVKEIYYSNGGSLNLDTNKVGPEGGLKEEYAKRWVRNRSVAEDVAYRKGYGESGDLGEHRCRFFDAGTHAQLDGLRALAQDAERGYSRSLQSFRRLCMTIAALQTGKRITFDDARQDVVIG